MSCGAEGLGGSLHETAAPLGGGPSSSSFACERWSWPARLDEIAAQYPDTVGVTDDTGVQLTWSELAYTSKVVAKGLRARGLVGSPTSVYPASPGEGAPAPMPIVVMLTHTAESLATIFGVLRQGFPLLPLSILHGDRGQLFQRYRDAMRLFAPAAIISDSPLAQELLTHRPGVPVISPRDLLLDESPAEEYTEVVTTLDCALAFIFTSGSSGEAKCVTATNRMAWAEVQWYPQLFRQLGVHIDPRKDRWRNDHEMGWWGAAYFGEIDVALAMAACIVLMKPTDSDIAGRGVTMMGALPSQLQNLWPGARGRPETLRALICWAERCDVELGQTWKQSGVKVADLLIATEFWLSLASANLELGKGDDGREAHAMRAVGGAQVFILTDDMQPLEPTPDADMKGMLGLAGPQVTPGYVELSSDGVAMVGAGPLSQDTFKVVNGQWVVVPKDIVRMKPDQSLLSVGRAGGLVKVKGGVLMATNVVELELQQKSITAACITDPLHVASGNCVALELQCLDEWSLREALQRTSFLRMPTLFMKKMPRNQSTGKVQKALVQGMLQSEYTAELEYAEEDRQTREAQLAWYSRLTSVVVVPCILQPAAVLNIGQALLELSPLHLAVSLGLVAIEVPLRFCLASWTYAAWAHAGQLGYKRAAGVPVVLALAGGVLRSAATGNAVAAAFLLAALVGDGVRQKSAGDDESGEGSGFVVRSWLAARKRAGHLGFAAVVALLPRALGTEATALYTLGLLSIIAIQRRLPPPPLQAGASVFSPQRLAAMVASFLETLGFMAAFPVSFALALPSLIAAQFSTYAWNRMPRTGQQLGGKQQGWAHWGAKAQLNCIQYGNYRDGALWFDVSGHKEFAAPAAKQRPVVEAETLAGNRAQALAKQAGVDFQSVDSLRIARLSVMIKKQFRCKAGQEPLEFAELREACVSEQKFVTLIDSRLDLVEEQASSGPSEAARSDVHLSPFSSWVQGGLYVHREGATAAPWDCQVDTLMEWTAPEPIDPNILRQALRDVMQLHPLLRARYPQDDDVDLMMGGRNNFSTVAAATWSLVTSCWSERGSWSRLGGRLVHQVVPAALWRCWPRTLVLAREVPTKVGVQFHSMESRGASTNLADDVYSHLYNTWDSWYDKQSAINACVITVNVAGHVSRQFFYSTISHKYADGGAAAAFLHSLAECYELRRRGEPVVHAPSPILSVQQERLWRYLQGARCPQGAVDASFSDIRDETFYHGSGQGVGATFSKAVCDVVRMAGLRIACSEEVAWLACITCALCRLLPDEKLIKLLIVHNGRLGDAEGSVACVSQYVMITIPCANERSNTPLADVASRVKFAITNGKFSRPGPCEQAHARINIGGMVGEDGPFTQVFKAHRPRKPGRSRAAFVLQLRMDNEGEAWSLKDFKWRHSEAGPQDFWVSTICAALEIAEGHFTNPLGW